MRRTARGVIVLGGVASLLWLGGEGLRVNDLAPNGLAPPGAVVERAEREAAAWRSDVRRASERGRRTGAAWGRCLRAQARALVRLARTGRWRMPGACGGGRRRVIDPLGFVGRVEGLSNSRNRP